MISTIWLSRSAQDNSISFEDAFIDSEALGMLMNVEEDPYEIKKTKSKGVRSYESCCCGKPVEEETGNALAGGRIDSRAQMLWPEAIG